MLTTTVQIFMMEEGRKEGRRVAKTSSILLKFEYVVVWGMGITELGTFLCVSKLLWVYESSEVLNFTQNIRLHNRKSLLA